MQYDTTKIYLTRVIPWVQNAFVNVHYTTPNKNFDPSRPANTTDNKKYWMNGQAFQTIDEVVSFIRYIQRKPDTLDVYIGMGAQARAEQRVGRGGRTFYNALRSKDFVLANKALYMDLDVKPNDANAYQTQSDLFTAFKQFLKDSGLPVPTLMVASGTGGAHAYWSLERVIHPTEWQPLAQALAEATRRHGFKCDTGVTVDSSRLLRLPETFNRKTDIPLPVVLGNLVQPHDITVEQMRKILTPYIGAQVIDLNVARRASTSNPNDELTGGIVAATTQPIDIASVAKQCGFVRDALNTGGAGFGNPLWNIATLLASFTIGKHKSGTDVTGREIAHAMARGHVTYVPSDTDNLYDRKETERAARNLGWPSCKAIENAGCSSCNGCQFKPFGKSPLSWGKTLANAVQAQTQNGAIVTPLSVGTTPPPAGMVPPGYVVTGDGTINKVIKLENGTSFLKSVSTYPMEQAYLQSNPWTLFFSTRLGPSPKLTVISIAMGHLQSREFAKYLAGQGMVSPPEMAKDLQEFLLSWVSQLQRIHSTVQSSPFGWSVEHGRLEGFVFGGRCWMPGSDRAAAVPHEVLAAQFRPQGELSAWQQACNFVTAQNRPDLNAIIAAAFGAPLMRFTGMSGAIVSAYSTASGIGKTTAMEVAQSIWGHSKKGMNSLDDTQNSVMNKAGQLRNLPLMWDELKGADQKQRFVRVAFQITGGKEKSRLNSDSVQRDPGTWQTIAVAASNDSLLDVIQRELKTTEAGLLRVFEYAVSPSRHPPQRSHGYVSRLVAQCQDHYGVAGLEYAKFLGVNFKRVEDEVAQCQDHMVMKLCSGNDERFWIATITCMLMGAKYAKELGLADIDQYSLYLFLKNTLLELRNLRKTTAVDVNRPDALANLLAAYLAEMATRYTLVTDKMPVQGKPNVVILNSDLGRLETVHVRHAKSDRIISIAKDPFVDWLVRRDMAPNAVLQALGAVFYVQTKQRILTGGTALEGSKFRRQCLDIDYNGTLFDAVMEGN